MVILGSQNKITDFSMILARVCPFNIKRKFLLQMMLGYRSSFHDTVGQFDVNFVNPQQK